MQRFPKPLQRFFSKMASSNRYFTNTLNDYNGSIVHIPKDVTKSRCLGYVEQIFQHQRHSADDCDGGLYVGIAGIAYMCYHLSQNPNFQSEQGQFFGKASEYLKHSLAYVEHPRVKSDKANRVSFMLGTGGNYVVAAVLGHAFGNQSESDMYIQRYAALADICLNVNFLKCGSDELFVGRAGYLCGLLFLQKVFKTQILPDDKIFAICETIVKSGTEYSRRVKSPCPLMYAYYDTEYLGAAHGLSAILQMLLSFPGYLERYPESARKIKGSVDFFLGLQTENGNFPCAMDEVAYRRPESNELVHWCHGAPGVVYLMAKAYLTWKDRKYLDSCLRCGEIVWEKGLLKKGPSICHGVAGSGYVFLVLYRLTNDEKHLHRALQFSNFLFEEQFKQARTPDRPLSLYEGTAGTACFLADLMEPQQAEFPFFDVF